MGNLGTRLGGVVQYLKDPALVRRVQEAFGVRQICVEVTGNGVLASSSPSSSSSEDDDSESSPRDRGKGDADGSATRNETALANGSSISWIKKKTRHRRQILFSPPESQDLKAPPAVQNVSTTEAVVIETNYFLDIYFRLATELGYEPFYITFLPFLYWNVDTCFARLVVITWCCSMYIGQGAKQLFKIKRPASPPAVRLEQNPSLETEYGFPSTHATVGTTIPFCLAYHLVYRYQVRDVRLIMDSVLCQTGGFSAL